MPLFALGVWLSLGDREARAQETSGFVLDIQNEDLILDLGQATGVSEGDQVEIWRPIKLKHPVTGRTVADRFLIGTLLIGQIRPSISLAKVVGALRRAPQKGDVVIAAGLSPKPARRPEEPAGDEPREPPRPEGPKNEQPPAEAPEAAAIARMFDGLEGTDPATRIRVYEAYVRARPSGRFAPVLHEEAQALRRMLSAERKASQRYSASEAPGRESLLLSFSKPTGAVAGMPLQLTMELGEHAAAALVHVRSQKAPAYRTFPMSPMGRGYFTAVIPAANLTDRSVQLFAEVTTTTGQVVAVVGDSATPEVIRLESRPPERQPPKLETTAMLSTDYADYNRLRGDDYVWQTEGTFGLRLGDTGVRALRTGFGVYRGYGGTVRELDEQGLAPRKVGLTYGYLETEVGFSRAVSLIGRAVVGLDDDGVSGGGQLMVRIGNDKDTNLVLGGELLGGIGLRGVTQLELGSFRRFPIVFRVEVTNQPAGASRSAAGPDEAGTVSEGAGEVGGRGIAQVGWRVLDPLVVSVRGSFQGRTINHAGPGFGAAVSYQW